MRSRTFLSTAAAAALTTAGAVGFAASPASAYSGVVNATTPGTYTWTVPAGVTSITVKAYGAQGGGVAEFGQGVGGHGAEVRATVAVTPGQVITYVVGAKPTVATNMLGGSGGGGNGAEAFMGRGAGGGGATYLSVGSTPLVVAGAGGGASEGVNGGDSGHMGGSLRAFGSAYGMGGLPGTPDGAGVTPGGSSAGLGADCRYRENGVAGQPGSSFQGGAGGGRADTYENYGGGGGGGGYYGGAGGGGGAYCAFWQAEHAAAGGGGGGSSYVVSGATSVALTDGFQSGNGAIVFQY
jgi:hypothetical protein